MGSFLSLAQEKKVLFDLRDYGVDDLSTGWVIKEMLENPDIFCDFYENFPLSKITNMEDYCLYLFSLRLSKLRDAIPRIVRDKDKEFVREIVDNADKVIDGIERKDVISFINTHVRDIFNREHKKNDLPLVTLGLIATYSLGIDKTVFDFLCTERPYLIVERFDDFEKIFKEYPDLFPLLFRIEKPEDLHAVHLDTVLDIWLRMLNKRESALKQSVDKGIDIFLENFEKLAENATPEKAFFIEKKVSDFLSFLRRIKSPKANVFVKCADKIAKLSQQYIAEHGHSFQSEIPVGRITEEWRKSDDWEGKLLFLTHAFQKDRNETVSHLEEGPEDGRLVDLCGTSIPTNEFFTISHQINLSLSSQVSMAIFHSFMVNQEILSNYLVSVTSALRFVLKQMDDNSAENLENNSELFLQMVQLLAQNLNNDESVIRPLCYGTSTYGVALLEALLRKFYLYLVKDEKYVPVSKTTLGQLLSVEKNPEITSVFGENHVKNLSFFLLRIPETDIGENIRNSLAHLDGVSPENFTPLLVAKVLWLFTDVLNTIFWYFLKTQGEDIEGM